MAAKNFYRNRNFSWGLNNYDAEHVLADPYSVVAKNVIVGEGYVESRNGLTLLNQGSGYTPAYLTGGSSATAVVGTWTAVSDGEFAITIDGAAHDITGIDFSSGVTTMEDVASKIQTALRAVTSSTETVDWNSDHFIVRSADTTSSSAITVTSAVSGGGGTDISGVGGTAFMDADNGHGTVTATREVTGGITMMAPIYLRDGTKKLLFANGDHYYTLPNSATSSTSWTDIGDYGTEVSNPFSTQYQNQAFIGTGSASNTQYRWDGTEDLTGVGTQADTSSDLRFAEYHQGANIAYLLGAGNARDNASHNNSILYYTTDVDDWSTGGTISVGSNDGQSITAVKSHSNILCYKSNSMYRMDVVYESNSGTNVLRVLERFQDIGAVNHEVCQVALNDVVSLSQRHGVRGFQQVQTKNGGSESKRLSTKIKPLIKNINWNVAGTVARSIVWDEKYFLAVPLNGSTTNNVVLVGHLDRVTDVGEIPWTLFDINAGSFAIFEDSNGTERLLIGDSNQPRIFIWDEDALSDNQSNINTQFRTKRIDMGDYEVDEFEGILLSGLMTEITEIQVNVYIDGLSSSYLITKDQILNDTGAVWSHIVGSEIVGGNSEETQRPRWLAVLPISDAQRVGSEVQIEIVTMGQGYYWRLDYLSINEPINENEFADRHIVSEEA